MPKQEISIFISHILRNKDMSDNILIRLYISTLFRKKKI